MACSWAAKLLTEKHAPQAMRLLAKSQSQAAELTALIAGETNASGFENRAHWKALQALCADNEKGAARLRGQIDQLLEAALPRGATPQKDGSECGPMCILAHGGS